MNYEEADRYHHGSSAFYRSPEKVMEDVLESDVLSKRFSSVLASIQNICPITIQGYRFGQDDSCEVVGERTYSAKEVTELLRIRRPEWFWFEVTP